MPLDLLDRIRSFPLFLSAPEEFLIAIGKHLRPQVHSPRDHILTEGDEAMAMYWLVRGAVAVTSRDGEATYAELKPGAFFGEIGILMDVPRTATIIARTKCLLVVLKKEDLRAELPKFPEMHQAIMDEAQERLTILNKKRRESGFGPKIVSTMLSSRSGSKAAREPAPGEVSTGDVGSFEKGAVVNHKKRKSPSPGAMEDPNAGSILGSGLVSVRKTLKELPLFSTLPPDILHFLGLNVQPGTYPPFTDIIRQGSPGNDIYFIVRGEAEVVHELSNGASSRRSLRGSHARPRLRQGQYFGEVASLALAPRRTATVRSITTVECLVISGEVLDELWKRCPPYVRNQVEATAKMRIGSRIDEDVPMVDADSSTPSIYRLEVEDTPSSPPSLALPKGTFTPKSPSSYKPSRPEDSEVIEHLDPDPFLSVDMDNMRSRAGRRSSWAPPPQENAVEPAESPPAPSTRSEGGMPANPKPFHVTTSCDLFVRPKRARTLPHRPSQSGTKLFCDRILTRIFSYLDIYHTMRIRRVSQHWLRLLNSSPEILRHLDLSEYNKAVTNKALIESICPFVGNRPWTIDISNCFHITDEGFNALTAQCSQNVRSWEMRSVWDITANAVLEMANNAKALEEIDLSNCRKVSDNLLARVVGWVVTDPLALVKTGSGRSTHGQQQSQLVPPAGNVVGCPKLKSLTLSYCKHVTDRSMAHLAIHAHARLQSLDLTRCTTITDSGFQHWSIYKFAKLERLILADCTYLTDNAIVYLTNAARGLKELDLVCTLYYRTTPDMMGGETNGSLVLLLRPVGHGNRSPLSWLPTAHIAQALVLRLGRLRLVPPFHRTPPARTPRNLGPRLRPRHRRRRRSRRRGLHRPQPLRRQPVQEPLPLARTGRRGTRAQGVQAAALKVHHGETLRRHESEVARSA